MQPPLTDLSWVTWGVWADWCADYRPKAEPFARKVVKSLRKMEAVGCDPKMLLTVVDTEGVFHYPKVTPLGFFELADRRINWKSAWWVAVRVRTTIKKWSPADLPKYWQDTRLAWKFWKCVNRRALGIKDSVLE